jgi:hypothetical protein
MRPSTPVGGVLRGAAPAIGAVFVERASGAAATAERQHERCPENADATEPFQRLIRRERMNIFVEWLPSDWRIRNVFAPGCTMSDIYQGLTVGRASERR